MYVKCKLYDENTLVGEIKCTDLVKENKKTRLINSRTQVFALQKKKAVLPLVPSMQMGKESKFEQDLFAYNKKSKNRTIFVKIEIIWKQTDEDICSKISLRIKNFAA